MNCRLCLSQNAHGMLVTDGKDAHCPTAASGTLHNSCAQSEECTSDAGHVAPVTLQVGKCLQQCWQYL